MHTLSPETILAVWEVGREQHELDRALTLLGAACPDISRSELAALSIGERDTRLLRLRTHLFGSRADGFAACPKCAAPVELPIDTAAFGHAAAPAHELREIEAGGTRLRFRPPSSSDLAEVVTARDAAEGLRRLVERCVTEVSGEPARAAGELRPEVLEALSRAMLEADPQAEITFALTCPNCGHGWSLLFDVADFLWHEIAMQARRLLREIDLIARAYGWSEHEILSLPARRRQSYLELIAG